jgi:hypothetical protein
MGERIKKNSSKNFPPLMADKSFTARRGGNKREGEYSQI